MATGYAEGTSVSAEKSRGEIERTLQRYGADMFSYGWEGNQAAIQFAAKGRRIRFLLPLPAKDETRFTTTPGRNHQRSAEAAQAAWEQACRQSWRALALVIKAKLEAVEANITTFESEFLANIVMPDGRAFAEIALPAIAHSYETGKPLLLEHGSGGSRG